MFVNSYLSRYTFVGFYENNLFERKQKVSFMAMVRHEPKEYNFKFRDISKYLKKEELKFLGKF